MQGPAWNFINANPTQQGYSNSRYIVNLLLFLQLVDFIAEI